MTRRTRRAPLAAATAMAAALALAACSGDTDPGAEAEDTDSGGAGSTPEGPFVYEDGRGETVELAQVPDTVVAQSSVAAALWDAGYQVDGVYGELGEVDGELNYQAGNIDVSQVDVLGEAYGELDVQQYGLMSPDLLIDYTFDGETLWYVPARSAKQVYDLAPAIGVDGNNFGDTDEAIETFVDLAGELGADTESEQLVADKQAYDDAVVELAANAQESGLEVVFVSADVDAGTFYVANPDFFPEVLTLDEAGVPIIEPKSGKPMHFHALSWEEAADYADADVIFFDARTFGALTGKLESIDTWAGLPAVEAGQVYPWYAAAPYSYKVYGDVYQEMADQLAEAEPLD